jgi:hypothetical protein
MGLRRINEMRLLFKRKEKPNNKIIGVTLGWDMLPTLMYGDGKILLRSAENIINGEFYPDGSGSWPIDPVTNEKIGMAGE